MLIVNTWPSGGGVRGLRIHLEFPDETYLSEKVTQLNPINAVRDMCSQILQGIRCPSRVSAGGIWIYLS